jgi:hypothetical protein
MDDESKKRDFGQVRDVGSFCLVDNQYFKGSKGQNSLCVCVCVCVCVACGEISVPCAENILLRDSGVVGLGNHDGVKTAASVLRV